MIQIASFHPEYQFEGTEPDDITNYTNRAPFPTLHLIREESLDKAVEAFPDAEMIYERNMETLRKLGIAGWLALGLHTPKPPATPKPMASVSPPAARRGRRPGRPSRVAPGPVGRAAEGAAHPHPRRPAQPGQPAQAQQVYHLYQFIEPLLDRCSPPAATSPWPTTAPASPTSASSSTTCS